MHRRTWLIDILLLTLVTSLLFSIFLGARNLSAPDELRYSEIPREMIMNQDYLIPTINGVKYFEKPALFYWMQVASIKSFGLHEWNLRLATMLMAVAGVLATYLFARRIYNRKTGWYAAIILSSMALYFAMAHVITLDMTVSVMITMSLYAFFLAIKYHSTKSMYLGFIAMAAAMMTKGLIALIFPGLIIGLWLTLFNRWRQVKWGHFFLGCLIFVALVAPWHILVQLRAPEFLHFYFIEQQFLRYATSIAHRYQPPYFYIPVILLGGLPWIFFLPKALSILKNWRWKNRWQYENKSFFLLWFLCIFLFFSASNSKLIPYVIACLPPLAMLIADYLAGRHFTKSLISIYLMTSTVFVSSIPFVDYFDNHTIKHLVLKVKPVISSQDEVIAYHEYHQDLPFYLERNITVDNSFNELEFGAKHSNAAEWMIHEKEFKERWLSSKKLYVFMNEKQYDLFKDLYPNHPGWIVAKDKQNVVITNHKRENR